MKRLAPALLALLFSLSALWFGLRIVYRDVGLRRDWLGKAEKHALSLSNQLLFFPAALPAARSYARVAVKLTPIVRGLRHPTALAVLPPPFRMPVVAERSGRLSRVDRRGVVVRWLDLEVTSEGANAGLLALAFHPRFAENGRLFLAYTDNREGHSVLRISEYVVPDPKTALEETPSFVGDLLVLERSSPAHASCALAFDSHDLLFVALGDGLRPSADSLRLTGSVLRLDVSAPTAASEGQPALPYTVPADNPFIADAQVAPEVFAVGVARPTQLASAGEALVLGDGPDGGSQSLWRVSARAYMGNGPKPSSCTAEKPCRTPEPVFTYSGALGHELAGPAISGKVQPARIAGHAIFGDARSGQLFAAPLNNDASRPVSLGAWPLLPRSFVQEATGSVLFADDARGTIYRIGPAHMHWADGFPAIFETVEDAVGL